MTPAAVPQFIDSYLILSISPSATKSERFQQLQDAYDAIKAARARKNQDALRDQYLAAREAAKFAAEAAILAVRKAEQKWERWERGHGMVR
ncbi:uncharacterized protein EAF02_010314 [Botrytis sinoallii]|uniref:uncharacterized protein n=1 Tax=Botrytis sinoallii TaxID=1463999 RepID=UPI0019003C67|nr:uncharacterized protein EAF02_010314 [Botrytis sinoallii]KAF7864346.1 hypothetical protein EAF02_010314 [Botrytis sinoallii]